MKAPDSLILYVADPAVSAAFYQALFAAPVVEQSPNFAMLALPGGLMLGLWAQHELDPALASPAGGLELGVTLASDQAVDEALAEARGFGAPVAQGPVRLDFGYTFVVRSPDGHLIRVFSPSEA